MVRRRNRRSTQIVNECCEQRRKEWKDQWWRVLNWWNIGNLRNEGRRIVRIVIVNFEETHKHKKERKKIMMWIGFGWPATTSEMGNEGDGGVFDGKFNLNKGYVAGILTVDNNADFLPRKGPRRHRRWVQHILLENLGIDLGLVGWTITKIH